MRKFEGGINLVSLSFRHSSTEMPSPHLRGSAGDLSGRLFGDVGASFAAIPQLGD